MRSKNRTKRLRGLLTMRYKLFWVGNALRFVPNMERNRLRCLPIGTEYRSSLMDVGKILTDLRRERDQMEEAILSRERLARGRGTRRGRPPAWMTEVKRRGRPPGSKNKAASSEEEPAAIAKSTSATA